MKRTAQKCLIVLFWLAVWQLAALIVHNPVLLVGPVETLTALFGMLPDAAFRGAVFFSWGRIFAGFLIGAVLGFALATLSFYVPFMSRLLSPFVTAVKAVPVACYAILLIFWFGSAYVALILSALVVFPILYVNTLQGYGNAEKELLEVAEVFAMSASDRFRHIYLPSLYPFLCGALQVAVGMSWKSGIAAEVIALRTGTLGNEMYRAKTLIETDKMFAVTLAVVLLSFLTEKAVMFLVHRAGADFFDESGE